MTANSAVKQGIRTYTFDTSPTRVRRKKSDATAPQGVKRSAADAVTPPKGARGVTRTKSVSASGARGAVGTKSVSAQGARGAVGAKSVSASDVRGKSGTKNVSASKNRTARRSVDDIRLKRALEAVDGKKAKAKAEPKVHTVASLNRIPFPTAVIFMTLICTVLFMAMIMSFVRINEMTIELESLDRTAQTLTKTQSELTLQLEKKNDLREIERYATEELGMVKIDQLTKKYLTLDVSEKIELAADTKESAALGFFEGIVKNIRDFFAYLG